ncbi:MAG: SiaB family protein kinase [Bacteroidota bacterium]
MLGKSVLSYQGPFSFSTIDSLLSEFKVAAQDHELSFKAYKKMISILIEALENVTKYSNQFDFNGDSSPDFNPSCQIISNASGIELVTSNPVRKQDMDSLRARIDNVNKRNTEELKELYRSTIANGEFSASGGAGLGFIEMAKTAGSKLEYSFENLSKDFSLFTFRIFIPT